MTSCQDKKFRQSVQGSYGECMNKFLKISGERKLVPFSLKNREKIKCLMSSVNCCSLIFATFYHLNRSFETMGLFT